jgi:Ca2+-binding RTX toxin-like protein
MADILGTEAADILTGTSSADKIVGLGGDDRIIGTAGSDTVDGGAGNDILDYTGTGQRMIVIPSSNFVFNGLPLGAPPGFVGYSASYSNIETIIGDPTRISSSATQVGNSISNDRRNTARGIDVDFAANRVDVYNVDPVFGTSVLQSSIKIKNFNDAQNVRKAIGSDANNSISAGIIIGSKGNDSLFGGIIDYSNLGRAVKFSSTSLGSINGSIEKGDFGKDEIRGFNKLIGASNQENSLDLSKNDTTVIDFSLDVNLLTNSLKLKAVPAGTFGDYNYEVVNFVNVVGTKNNDSIVGSNTNSKLTGGAGSDIIQGGTNNDRITGTDSTARGVGEVDTLTGGAGSDRFVLGNSTGAYYVGNKRTDYAQITDFNILSDSIDVGNLKNYSFAIEKNGMIDLFSGKNPGTRDLIAKIQLDTSGLGTGAKTANSSIMAGVDSITSQINILSGANSIAIT